MANELEDVCKMYKAEYADIKYKLPLSMQTLKFINSEELHETDASDRKQRGTEDIYSDYDSVFLLKYKDFEQVAEDVPKIISFYF